MTKPKQIPRLGRRINCKEVAMLLNELNNLDGTRFRPSGVFAHITQMGIVIPPNPGEDQLFRMWLTSFVKCLNTGVPGLKCASGEERHWTRRAYGTRQEVPA
jgi:hypothetical protein